MPYKSSKQQNVQSVTMTFSGGLNWAQSRANIADNEVTRAFNFIYDPETDYLITRPGTTCQTAAALPAPITASCYYEKSPTEAYHICAAGKKLYYILNEVPLGDTWTEIGTDQLTGDYPPSFEVFNNMLFIADGDAHIKTWNGTTFDTGIADSPSANALCVIKNRLVANSITDLDLVTLSAPADASATGWNTTTTAVGLRAGFGDMLSVNAFGVFGDDLIISKKGDNTKRIYRLNVSDAVTGWYIADLSQNNAAQNAQSMVAAWNNVFFVDTNGFKSVKGTDTYGDLAVDSIGRKINVVFQSGYECDIMSYLPIYNTLWFSMKEKVYAYTERFDTVSGATSPAFTDLAFMWGQVTSMYQAGDTVYLTGYNGYLYKLDETVSTDETSPGVTAAYRSRLRTKTVPFFGDGILRKIQFYLTPIAAGTGTIGICTEETSKTVLKSITLPAEGMFLFDATGFLNDATEYLYDTGTSPWVETSRNRLRNDEMAFELEILSGRCGVEWCKAEIALVEGGD